MRLAWMTDIHLEFAETPDRDGFYESIRAANAALLVTGDISNASRLESDLGELREAANGHPVYFVLGNHDYYGGSIKHVRERVVRLCQRHPELVWLTGTETVELGPDTALIGDDGWGDCTLGDPLNAVGLNDEFLISELRPPHRRNALFLKLRRLGEESAQHVRESLTAALGKYRHILLATHVPPFRDACWHQGSTSADDWLPRFTCDAVGRVLREVMTRNPENRLTVYCGHSHGEGHCEILANLDVWTGGAEYRYPRVQRIIEIN